MFLQRNPLMRLVGVNLLIGVCVSLGVVVALIVFDVGHLRSLVLASRDGALALSLLTFGFVITLSSTAIGSAIMSLPHGAEHDDKGCAESRRAAFCSFALQPAPVRVRRVGSPVR